MKESGKLSKKREKLSGIAISSHIEVVPAMCVFCELMLVFPLANITIRNPTFGRMELMSYFAGT